MVRSEAESATPELWGFMRTVDKNKLAKAGFATPRGGGKNAYQNHVSRSNRVIIPFERLDDVDLDLFRDGYVIRLLPQQCFSEPGVIDPALAERGLEVGKDCFVLYKTKADYEDHYPPLVSWSPRGLGTGEMVRKRGVPDTGEYVVRLSNPTLKEGLPQGIFAPEYATADDNVLSKAVLAWLMGKTRDTPYAPDAFEGLAEFINSRDADLLDRERLDRGGVVVDDEARCPLCLRPLLYPELHEMLDLSEAAGLANAGIQVVGSTRSTAINLFHLKPLLYAAELHHEPRSVAWGHAVCNTILGQRSCISLAEVRERGFELLLKDGELWGHSADDESMLRSEDRGVWARLVERGLGDTPLTEALGSEVVIAEGEEEDLADE